MSVKFTFPQETPRFRWIPEGSGYLQEAGTFAKGEKAVIASACQQVVPGRGRIGTFEIWQDGSAYYFDPQTAGISKRRLRSLATRLNKYRIRLTPP